MWLSRRVEEGLRRAIDVVRQLKEAQLAGYVRETPGSPHTRRSGAGCPVLAGESAAAAFASRAFVGAGVAWDLCRLRSLDSHIRPLPDGGSLASVGPPSTIRRRGTMCFDITKVADDEPLCVLTWVGPRQRGQATHQSKGQSQWTGWICSFRGRLVWRYRGGTIVKGLLVDGVVSEFGRRGVPRLDLYDNPVERPPYHLHLLFTRSTPSTERRSPRFPNPLPRTRTSGCPTPCKATALLSPHESCTAISPSSIQCSRCTGPPASGASSSTRTWRSRSSMGMPRHTYRHDNVRAPAAQHLPVATSILSTRVHAEQWVV